MNVLLVNNVASFHSTLANSLNAIPNIHAKYIITSRHKFITENQYGYFIPLAISKKNPFTFILHKLTYKRKIKKLIEWSDVVYFLWDNLVDEFDLKYASSLKKPIFVEWVGSDIRDPNLLARLNPWFAKCFENGYEYRSLELSNHRVAVQQKFKKYRANVLTTPEMKLFVDSSLFPESSLLFQRIDTSKYQPYYPDKSKLVPKIIHAPSAPIAKGTPEILKIIDELKREYKFEFVLLENMSREDVVNELKQADIFIDQIVLGSYGMASCEAMAFGKPVLCFIMDEVFENGLPVDCPIVNSNTNTLKNNLIRLLDDANLRNEIGQQSRLFAEKYHDSDKIAHQLVQIFNQFIL
jgi:glycosyltransferase involved in cell wall biosynthesis